MPIENEILSEEAQFSAMQNNEFLPESLAALSPGMPVGQFLSGSRDQLPDIPAMNTTRLKLELLLQDSWIDLSTVAEVILSDAGATLQIFRLIGEEYPEDDGRPTRIEDCIVALGLERWFDAVCALSVPHHSGLFGEWQHCRRVAQCAKELAECVTGFSPEEAYVIGLLCELGRFPYLLGWNSTGNTASEHKALGVMLADYWHLPQYLVSAIREQQHPTPRSRWNELLHIARNGAERLRHSPFSEQA